MLIVHVRRGQRRPTGDFLTSVQRDVAVVHWAFGAVIEHSQTGDGVGGDLVISNRDVVDRHLAGVLDEVADVHLAAGRDGDARGDVGMNAVDELLDNQLGVTGGIREAFTRNGCQRRDILARLRRNRARRGGDVVVDVAVARGNSDCIEEGDFAWLQGAVEVGAVALHGELPAQRSDGGRIGCAVYLVVDVDAVDHGVTGVGDLETQQDRLVRGNRDTRLLGGFLAVDQFHQGQRGMRSLDGIGVGLIFGSDGVTGCAVLALLSGVDGRDVAVLRARCRGADRGETGHRCAHVQRRGRTGNRRGRVIGDDDVHERHVTGVGHLETGIHHGILSDLNARRGMRVFAVERLLDGHCRGRVDG